MDCIKQTDARYLVVSNEVGLGIVPADPLYRDLLGQANQTLAHEADEVNPDGGGDINEGEVGFKQTGPARRALRPTLIDVQKRSEYVILGILCIRAANQSKYHRPMVKIQERCIMVTTMSGKITEIIFVRFDPHEDLRQGIM